MARMLGSCPVMRASIMALRVSPILRRQPASASHIITPTEKMSARASIGLPRNCSGAP
jgi:hypothetical protein